MTNCKPTFVLPCIVAVGQILLFPKCPKFTTQLDLVPVEPCSHLRVEFLILPNPPHSLFVHLGQPPLPENKHLLDSCTISSKNTGTCEAGGESQKLPPALPLPCYLYSPSAGLQFPAVPHPTHRPIQNSFQQPLPTVSF